MWPLDSTVTCASSGVGCPNVLYVLAQSCLYVSFLIASKKYPWLAQLQSFLRWRPLNWQVFKKSDKYD
ncbi:hypothetical protein DM01DRAFT_303735 [Hesseltinella vesiculosa]|uniref:Uncharacterized protein n=1 Tax=Hesseltinella vesiculosa TaxID=101127 RepID=A0A1X2GIQ1_9FUNG|nr:hypothetical protein DM01DRAFT_303735 [Hesseltinella vesiculosa]